MQIILNEQKFDLSGRLLDIGEDAPDVIVTDLNNVDINLSSLGSDLYLFNVFPKIQGKVCSSSMLLLEQYINNNDLSCKVFSISCDPVEVLKEFRLEHKISNVVSYSDANHNAFGKNYGLLIRSGPLANYLARAVILIKNGSR